MKAAVIAGPEKLEIMRIPAPDPEPGEIVARLEGCGVCALEATCPPQPGQPESGSGA